MFLELLLIIITIIIVFITIIIMPTHLMHLSVSTLFRMSKLPGPRGLLPVFGLAHLFPKLHHTDLLKFFSDLQRDYPRLAAFWVIGVPSAILFDVDDIEVLLSSVHHIQKGNEYLSLISWLQEGLLTSTGTKWHQRRKLLTPAFHFKILEDSMQSLNKHARFLLKNLLKKDGQPFIAEKLIIPCTLDIICETAMGYSLNLQNENEGHVDYLKAVRKVCELAVDRILKVCYSKEWFYRVTEHGKTHYKNLNYLHNFTEKIIKERKMNSTLPEELNLKNKLDEDDCDIGKKRKAFLDILIELDKKEGNLFTDKDIREEVDTFMFEGHDTTNAALVHTMYLLGRHPDIQEKAYQELYEIFGDSERAITRNDLNEMHYLEMIIKESLRLYPSVPYISRKLTQELHLRGNVILPIGVVVAVMPFLVHRDPKYYPNPEIFDPERFSVDNCVNRHPYAYIPFSAGPRNCIGQKFAIMELKVVLSTIIRFVKIYSVNEVEESKFVPTMILRSHEPIQLKVSPRI